MNTGFSQFAEALVFVHGPKAETEAARHALLCERAGNARPEEGSEHYFAYALEHRTRRHYLHGALVGLGVMLAGAWQGQDIAPVATFLRDVGLDCRFEAVGCTAGEVRDTLRAMDAYLAHESQLLPGVFHFRGAPGPDDADRLIAQVEAALERA